MGRAHARLMAERGADIVVADMNGATAHETGEMVRALGRRAHVEIIDMGDAAQVQMMVERSTGALGRIDILVNNAGIVFSYDPIHVASIEDWNKVIAVNQTGVFFGMRAVLPTMQKHRSGSIINISSIWGVVGAAGVAPYQAAKGAVRTMTKNAAITYAADNIRANSIHPGIIWTPLIEAQEKAITDSIVADTPLGRLGRADEVAYGAVFLASDESSFVTGVELAIDGGILAK
jgi:NAD(P)-dependent dehydrogenase (short-subunit alcohol dehydrogenase family)